METKERLIFREKPKSNYTKLKNSTLRKKIIGNRVNTFQIWIFALSCRFDCKITWDIIAKEFKISRFTANRHLKILIKNKLAIKIENFDENGGSLRSTYKIFEKPYKLEREGEMYKHALKDPKWQRKRLEIFKRDNWSCQKCGDKKSTLCVHHESYIDEFQPWEYPDDMLITLCEECHKNIHDGEID